MANIQDKIELVVIAATKAVAKPIATAIARYIVTVWGCEFWWKHPDATRQQYLTRMEDERDILLSKASGVNYVWLKDRFVRPHDENRGTDFTIRLLQLSSAMVDNGATKEELDSIEEIHTNCCYRFGPRKPTLSINNLRWIQKMEDKYGFDRKENNHEAE